MTNTPAEDSNISGLCFLCHQEVVPIDAPNHVRGCTSSFGDKTGPNDNYIMLIAVRTKERPHWMELALKPDSTIADLGDFLQRVWLDCCDHPSTFFAKQQIDPSEQPGTADLDIEGTLVQADHDFVHQPIEEILDHGSKFEYHCNQIKATKF